MCDNEDTRVVVNVLPEYDFDCPFCLICHPDTMYTCALGGNSVHDCVKSDDVYAECPHLITWRELLSDVPPHEKTD